MTEDAKKLDHSSSAKKRERAETASADGRYLICDDKGCRFTTLKAGDEIPEGAKLVPPPERKMKGFDSDDDFEELPAKAPRKETSEPLSPTHKEQQQR